MNNDDFFIRSDIENAKKCFLIYKNKRGDKK